MNVYKYLLRVLIAPLAIAVAVFPATGADTAAPNKPIYGSIAGIARTPAGLPLASATITALRLDGTGTRASISGSDGIYSFADVVPGKYSVTVEADGYADSDGVSAEVTAGHTTRLDMTSGNSAAPAVISSTNPSTKPTAQPAQPAPTTVATATASKPTSSNTGSGISLNRWVKELDQAYATKAAKTSAAAATTPDSAKVASLGTPPVAALDRPAPDAPQAAAAPAAPEAPKSSSVLPDALSAPEPPPPGVDTFTPFAFGDFSWLNGSPRNSPVLDTKFFTPEVRFDYELHSGLQSAD